MSDEHSILDNVGTGRGIETIGDVMREKKLSEAREKRDKIAIVISIASIVIAVLSLIVSILK